MGTTPTYGWRNDFAPGETLPSAELNLRADDFERVAVQTAELLGPGIWEASDFNGSIVAGQLTVNVSTGTALVGDEDGQKVVVVSDVTAVTGLAASALNYVFLKRDGTFTHNTTGTGPANSLLALTATTDATEVTGIDSAPAGRVDLLPAYRARVSANDAAGGFLNGKLVAGSGIALTEQNDGADETLLISTTGTSTDEKTKASPTDTTAKTLSEKLTAGASITITKQNAGGDETLLIDAVGAATDEKVRNSSGDTTPGHLTQKLAAGSGIAFSTLNPGGNEQTRVAHDGSVKVTAADTTPQQLSGKIASPDGLDIAVGNAGGDEVLNLTPQGKAAVEAGAPLAYLTDLLEAGANLTITPTPAGSPTKLTLAAATGAGSVPHTLSLTVRYVIPRGEARLVTVDFSGAGSFADVWSYDANPDQSGQLLLVSPNRFHETSLTYYHENPEGAGAGGYGDEDEHEVTLDIHGGGFVSGGGQAAVSLAKLGGAGSVHELVWSYAAPATGDNLPWLPAKFGSGGTIEGAYAVAKTAGSTQTTIEIEKSAQSDIDGTPSWSTIFSTPITLDANERSSETASTPPALGTTTFGGGDHFRLRVTTVGTSLADITVALRLRTEVD